MSDNEKRPMTDEEVKEDSRRRMKAATEALRNMFAVARMGSDHEGHRLAFALMEEAMTEGSKVGMAKRRYADGTTEAMRRDAAGVIQLIGMMATKMADVLTLQSAKMRDSFIVRVDMEQGYDCGDPDCPVHGKNAAKPGDVLRPDQLGMLPEKLAAGFAELMKQGLIVKHVGKHGPFGAVEIQGPKHLLAQADALMAQESLGVDLPEGVSKEIGKQPLDAHTQEISDALDKAFGRSRTHLPPKDIPLS